MTKNKTRKSNSKRKKLAKLLQLDVPAFDDDSVEAEAAAPLMPKATHQSSEKSEHNMTTSKVNGKGFMEKKKAKQRSKRSIEGAKTQISPKKHKHRTEKESLQEHNGAKPKGTIIEKSVSHKKTGLLDKMKQRLQGSQFRWLNEKLYTCTGDDAWKLMQKEEHLFHQYHSGFQHQTENWPVKPVDSAIQWLKNKPKHFRIADFGCGDAKIASVLKGRTVFSLDLVAKTDNIIACNMAQTPLESHGIDIAVFCLALMGTDYGVFLVEAHRVVKPGGLLWIAEVRSRFSGMKGGDTSNSEFISSLSNLGFKLLEHSCNNKMFVVFIFEKVSDKIPVALTWPTLTSCVYKKR